MKIQLHNTTKIVELVLHDGDVHIPARIWEGHTEAGVPVIAFITRIAAQHTDDLVEFERDLEEQTPPTADVQAWPLRMFLD